MINLKLLRQDLQNTANLLKMRGFELDIKQFKELEQERKDIQSVTEALQAKRNKLSKEIGKLKAQGLDAAELTKEVEDFSEQLKQNEIKLEQVQRYQQDFALQIPNLPSADVPFGESEENNVEIYKFGDVKKFPFKPKDHVELGEILGGLDFETAVKLTGSRFNVISGDVARLHRALSQFMLDEHIQNGYLEVNPPFLANEKTLQGTGQLPKFQEDLFKLTVENNLYLIPTAEVVLTNLVQDKIVSESNLPIKLVAHTPCFRSEAGSSGKDTRGMIRQHQFEKVELVHIVHPNNSANALEELTNDAENILKKLLLPYRKILLCTGDMGFSATKTYDLEVWIPSQNKYREISSCSNCTDFQARRMSARFKSNNKTELLHTLNGSGLAVGRTLVAVLENNQNEDGSIDIPEILHKYTNGLTKIMRNRFKYE